MPLIELSNQQLQVRIDPLGAEVRAVVNRSRLHNYLWSGDAKVWSGVSPLLFPVVGKSAGGVVWHEGQSYSLTNHGFARHCQFNIVEQSQTKVVLQLLTNQAAMSAYPFNLELRIGYELVANRLLTTFIVTNLDDSLAYFSLGAHPAFRCPFDELHNYSDYILQFEQPEELLRYQLAEDGLLGATPVIEKVSQIALSPQLFAADALIYTNLTSKNISLIEKDSGRYIKVSLAGFPWLGLWAKPGAPYVCIEPWCGHSDVTGFVGELKHKAAIEQILPKQGWQREYTIEFGY